MAKRRGLLWEWAAHLIETPSWPEFFTAAAMLVIGAALAAVVGLNETLGAGVGVVGTKSLFALAAAWERAHPSRAR